MNFITDVILPLALAFIMFTLGLGLTFSDFARVVKAPKNFIIGLISQLIFSSNSCFNNCFGLATST